MILKGFAMTRLEIITQFLSKMVAHPERELLSWAQENIDPGVMLKLKEEVSSEEISALVSELEKGPEAFLSMLLRQISWENAQTKSTLVNSASVEATIL